MKNNIKDIPIGTTLIIIFLLTGIGIFGSIVSGRLGYILAFVGISGLVIMGIYAVFMYRQQREEIIRRKTTRKKEYDFMG